MRTINDILKEIRLEKRITRKEVEQRAKIKTTSLCNIEQNKNNLTMKNFFAYCHAIGVKPSDIIKEYEEQ